MLNRLRQRVRALAAASGSRVYQFALLAEIRPAIGKMGGDTVLVVIVLAAVLVAVVILPAVWSTKPTRRRAALAVLDRILRWKP